ncbi:MAG: hypothetical protein KF712_03900 [Akkermansiaceae bacterium]|nr:hypothetical protein [Akkermansiaceae bacterium]
MRTKFSSMMGMLAALGQVCFAQGYQASVEIDTARVTGKIEQDIYGQYLEHVDEADECIYPSIWDNTSPKSDAMGLRKDVMAAVRDLKVPVVRWPGGCFADVYHWENGIGPRDKRPVLPNKHWGGNESHQFGTDEFLQWSAQVGTTPYVNVNLGSGTLDEALRWLEYCNGPATSEQGKRRAANGHAAPYNVPYWGIGNETWGPWETGHTDAVTYSKMLAEWATAMRKQDPSIKILAVGSNAGSDPKWDREVLKQAGDKIDYLTLHAYGSSVNDQPDEYEAVVFTAEYFDFAIRRMLKTIDDHKAETGLKNDVRISMDEWNIRHFATGKGDFKKNLRRKDPRNVEDMMFVAGTLNVMVRHSPRVAMANYVFLINGHAPMLVNAEGVVKTPLYHVFRQYAEWMNGSALEVKADSPVVTTPPPRTGGMTHKNFPKNYDRKEAPLLDTAAALRADGTLVISLINRHGADAAEVALKLPPGYQVKRSWTMGDADAKAVNDFTNPERVMPVETEVTEPAASWMCAARSVVLLSCEKVK